MLELYVKILRVAGFWPRSQSVAYRLYFVLAYAFMLGIFIVAQTVDLYRVRGNIPLMTADAFILFTNFVHTVKIFTVIRKRKVIEYVISELNKLVEMSDVPDSEFIIKKYSSRSLMNFVCYATWTFLVLQLWILGPLISNYFNGQKNLPLNGWYPYDVKRSPGFELTYAQQAIALYTGPFLNVTKDCLITGLINQVTCQLELLRGSLQRITENLKNDFEDEAYVELRSCIIRHQKILKIAKKINESFTIVILVQFTVSLIIICVTAFQMAMQVGKNYIGLFGMGTYLLNMICQVYLYCWHGNEVMVQSEQVLISAYVCEWYNLSPKFKFNLRTLMIRSMKPVVFSAGGFTTLSISTFTSIMKVSYSFFTVLQQVEEL